MKPRICTRCPTCGNRAFEAVRPVQFVAFRNDRRCTACDTRYSPPTPVWAALLFIVLGLTFVVGCTGSIIIAIARGSVVSLPLNAAFAVLGVLCLRQGVLSWREEVATAPDPSGSEPDSSLQILKVFLWHYRTGLGLMAVAAVVLFGSVELARRLHRVTPSRDDQRQAAIRTLTQLGGQVHGTNNGRPVAISLERSDAYRRQSVGQNVGLREIVDDDVNVIAGFPDLEDLTIRSTEITDAGLQQLKPQPEMIRFHVECPLVTEDGLGVIARMERLEFLNLAGTGVRGLSTFAFDRKTRLIDLNLAGTGITSDALAQLTSLKALQRLDLSETEIGDECLTFLAEPLQPGRIEAGRDTGDGRWNPRPAIADASEVADRR